MVGYGSKKLGVLSDKDSGTINSVVINLALPAFIFTSIHDKPLTLGMVKAPVVGIAACLVTLAVAYGVARLLKLDRPTTGALMIAATFGNTGYMGLPFVSAAFHGDKASIQTAVMMDAFGMRLPLCTAGIAVATCFAAGKFRWRDMLEFFRTPLFPAVVLGLVFRTTPIPDFLMKAIEYMGGATVPLSMISVGMNLSIGLAAKWPLGIAAAVLIKLALMPAIAYLGMPYMGIEHSVARIGVIEMGMPSAIFGGVIAGRYGANKELVAGAVFVSTLLSVVALPIVLMLVK